MRFHTYVVQHDHGFAPNPFGTACTLACCKPVIRRYASVGEYVVGTGSAARNRRMHARLVYWMKIDEIITYDEYWQRNEFRSKKPYMRGSLRQRYGDNIYKPKSGGGYSQLDSFHSEVNGKLSKPNLKRDTGRTNRVLIGREYTYWGRSGPQIPKQLHDFVMSGQGHKAHFERARIEAFLKWLSQFPERGYIDEPIEWSFTRETQKKP